MVHRGSKDQDGVVPDPTRDRVAEADGAGGGLAGLAGPGEDAMGWDEQVTPDRPSRGPALRAWLRALPPWALGVALVTVATGWPWLLLLGWLQRGGPYFWWFVLGCLLVVAVTWLRFLDERTLRAVPGIRGPSAQREAELVAALAAAGAPPATVWLGRVGTDRTRCLATPTRCHVVVPHEPSVDDATLAADAAARLRTGGPWLRPLTLVAGAAWLGPFTLLAQVFLRRLGLGSGRVPGTGDDAPVPGRLDASGAVDPITTAVAFLATGLTGFAVASTAAAVLGEGDRLNLNASNPWVTVAAYALFAGLTWMILCVRPKEWRTIAVDGVRSSGTAPTWRGTNDRREAMRNRAVITGRRGLAQVFGAFGSWFAVTMWCMWAPLGLMERFGWVESATPTYRWAYLVLALPGIALGVYAFRSGWDLQRGNPFFVLLWSAVYLVTTGLTPLLVWCLAAAHVVDDASGPALVVGHAAVGLVLAGGLGSLARHHLQRRGFEAGPRPAPAR